MNLVIVTQDRGLKTDIGRQVVESKLFDITCIAIVFFDVFERLKRFGVRGVHIAQVALIVFRRFVDGFRVGTFSFVVCIAHRKIGRVIRHRVFTFDVHLHVVQCDAFSCYLLLRQTFQ